MANPEHLEILGKGVGIWNEWRHEKPEVEPDLSEANLRRADLSGANLIQADLRGANLSEADLEYANFIDIKNKDTNKDGPIETNNVIQEDILAELLYVKDNKTGVTLNFAGYDNSDFINDDEQAENVRFSSFYPAKEQFQQWHDLLVYAHLDSMYSQIQRDAYKVFKGSEAPSNRSTSKKTATIKKGAVLSVAPFGQGIEFDPKRIEVEWNGSWKRAQFKFRVNENTENKIIYPAEIGVFIGAIRICTIDFTVTIDEIKNRSDQKKRKNKQRRKSALPYRHIFVSYSHRDKNIVDACANVERALGDGILIDYKNLRSGEEWDEGLLKLIDKADVFQLFWSKNSAQSKPVEREYKYALKKRRKYFIRPVYWQEPMPEPPKKLGKLHFHYLELDNFKILSQ